MMYRTVYPLLWALLTACGSPQPLRVGIVLDGDGVLGAQFAADDINTAGGIKGRPLELRVLSNLVGSVARESLTAAETLATDPSVLVVVGHTNSAASLAAAQIYNSRGLVQIAPTSTAPLYSDAGPYSFRLVASDAHQGRFLADAIAKEASGRRIAVLYVNDDYGRALEQVLAAELAKRGIAPVHVSPYAEGARFTSADDITGALSRARPDLLVWLGREPELRLLLPKVRAAKLGLRVFASDGFTTPRRTLPGGESLVGVRYVRLQDPSVNSPEIARLRARFPRSLPYDLSDQYLLSYQAVQLAAEAISVGGATREQVRQYLSELGTARPAFRGILGDIVFDKYGDAPPRYHLVEVAAAGTHRRDSAAGNTRLP